MTPKEVQEHLKDLKTDEDKLAYLRRILKNGEKLLSSGTWLAVDDKVREALGRQRGNAEHIEEQFKISRDPHYARRAALAYEKVAELEGDNCYGFERQMKYIKAAMLWEKIGDHTKAALAYEKAGYDATAERIRKKFGVHTGGLENAAATASIVGVLGGIFFLSANITGNAIANMTNSTSNFLGAGLLIIGLVSGFFWIKGKKSN